MFKSYFKIAFRYFAKNRIFSVINILGLTIGFTCFILLSLYVTDELSFDTFHSDGEQIYRVVQNIKDTDGSKRSVAGIAPAIGPQAKAQFPEVQDLTWLTSIGRVTVGNEPLNRDYEVVWIANANFFRFFNFEFLQGNPETVLLKPDNIVITESTALKYFGETHVMGKTLYTNRYEATVGAVIKDFPKNSHISMNIIHTQSTWAREISGWKEWVSTNWTSNSFITYLKMKAGFDKITFEEKLAALVSPHYNDDVKYSSTFTLQPLKDIHLYSQDINGGLNVSSGNQIYIYMFSIVGILILAIACFNYMNLSTAAGSRRTREVAMRKTLGAGKKQLMLQFIGEALVLSLFSLALAIGVITILIPYINEFIGKELILPLNNFPLLVVLGFIALAAALVSAMYPSFFLSKVNPATALKSEIKIGGGRFSLRKFLVVAQFTISIIMITTTIVIYQQLSYLQSKNLGFNVNNLFVVDINSRILRSQFESIKQEFLNLSEVQSVTVSSRVPGEWKVFPVANVEDQSRDKTAQLIFVGADKDFLQTYDIELVSGRNLRNDISDSNSVLISESAVKELSLQDPVGKTLNISGTLWAGDFDDMEKPYTPRIVGIIKDFYFQSFYEEQKPIMLASYRNPIHKIDYYTLKIKTSDWQKTINDLKAINGSFDPENPVEYTFLDNHFAEFYAADKARGELFLLFSGMIIFIACMGLFALASFAIENRIKEIGVRKVLGASISQITWLLSGEFALLVGVAFVIATPLSYLAIQSWLQEFAYRIAVPFWAFPAAGFAALIIALGSISFQTIRAAMANPVESIRYE